MQRIDGPSDANMDRAQPALQNQKTTHPGSQPPALLTTQYKNGKPAYEWRLAGHRWWKLHKLPDTQDQVAAG